MRTWDEGLIAPTGWPGITVLPIVSDAACYRFGWQYSIVGRRIIDGTNGDNRLPAGCCVLPDEGLDMLQLQRPEIPSLRLHQPIDRKLLRQMESKEGVPSARLLESAQVRNAGNSKADLRLRHSRILV